MTKPLYLLWEQDEYPSGKASEPELLGIFSTLEKLNKFLNDDYEDCPEPVQLTERNIEVEVDIKEENYIATREWWFSQQYMDDPYKWKALKSTCIKNEP